MEKKHITGFVMLVAGPFGLDIYMNDAVPEMIGGSVYAVALFGGLMIGLAAYYAYKANSNFGACTFGWVSLSLMLLAAAGGAFGGLFTLDVSFISYGLS